MEQHKLEITLEQRDWERLQKLSERNGESKESLVAKVMAAHLAKLFAKPPDEPILEQVKELSGLFRNQYIPDMIEEKYFKNASNKNKDW